MKPNPGIVVFSDVDGMFLDAEAHAFAAAATTLQPLALEGVPLVLCSGNTRGELEVLQHQLGLNHPFICEHGGAVLIPSRYFGFDVPGARDVAGYQAVEFGRTYVDVVERLHRIAERLHIEVVGFSDMSVEEVARDCHLPLLRARLAKLREYEELFRVQDGRPAAQDRLFNALHAAGLRCINGRRYHFVGGAIDRSLGVNLLCTLYRQAFGSPITVGLADGIAAENLLPFVNYPVIVQSDGTASGAASMADWAEAIVDIVRDLRRSGLPSAAAAARGEHGWTRQSST